MATIQDPLPSLPGIGIDFPNSPTARAAFTYSKENCRESVHNHAVRTAYFALLLAKKMPQYASDIHLDREAVVVACILHDLGLATTQSLISKDKRFEVDGANAARSFVLSHDDHCAHGHGDDDSSASLAPAHSKWDKGRVQLLWDTIALHTTASISLHKEPEVSLAFLAITADFAGPQFPGGLISLEEYREIHAAFPRAGFYREDFVKTACGLCRDKPDTTFDSVIGRVGYEFGTDEHGGGRDEYRAKWENGQPVHTLISQLDYLESLDKGDGAGGHWAS